MIKLTFNMKKNIFCFFEKNKKKLISLFFILIENINLILIYNYLMKYIKRKQFKMQKLNIYF